MAPTRFQIERYWVLSEARSDSAKLKAKKIIESVQQAINAAECPNSPIYLGCYFVFLNLGPAARLDWEGTLEEESETEFIQWIHGHKACARCQWHFKSAFLRINLLGELSYRHLTKATVQVIIDDMVKDIWESAEEHFITLSRNE